MSQTADGLLSVRRQIGRGAIRLLVGFIPCELLFLLLGRVLAIPRSSIPGEALEELLLDAILVVPVLYGLVHAAWLVLSFGVLSAGNWPLWASIAFGAVVGIGLGLIQWQIPISHFAWWLGK